jgi:GNAT superfamily N-acetyltransferase
MSTTKSPITLRPARWRDIPTIARLLSIAFHDDVLFGHTIHPHRNKYPQDTDYYWLRRGRVHYWDPSRRWLVATVRDAATGREEIVGQAQWERLGEGARRLGYGWFDPRESLQGSLSAEESPSANCFYASGRLLSPITAAIERINALIWPNRAADPAKEDIIERSGPFMEHLWSGDRAESWYLEFIAVRPDYQGSGVGRKLLQWGLDKAEEGGVCMSLVSAPGKDAFYIKAGMFVDGNTHGGEGNPLNDVEVANVFWKLPEKQHLAN